MTDTGLKPEVLHSLITIFEKYPSVEQALVYGSRAMGTYRHNSDIDLTLKGEGITFADQYNIYDDIDELYLPYQIDLSRYAELRNPSLTAHIDAVGRVLYTRRSKESSKATD